MTEKLNGYHFANQREAEKALAYYQTLTGGSLLVHESKKHPGRFMVTSGGLPIWFSAEDRGKVHLHALRGRRAA